MSPSKDAASRYWVKLAVTRARTYGMPVGLTAGLYLIGHGYKLIATHTPPGQCAAMLAVATEGHCDLCHGQGAELLWMRKPTPLPQIGRAHV
jgi:hypothetical protein